MGAILAAVAVGAIIGGAARLILPGHQHVSVLVTVLLGVLGSLSGSWLVHRVVGDGSGAFVEPVPFLAGVLIAALLIGIYGLVLGRRSPPTD